MFRSEFLFDPFRAYDEVNSHKGNTAFVFTPLLWRPNGTELSRAAEGGVGWSEMLACLTLLC